MRNSILMSKYSDFISKFDTKKNNLTPMRIDQVLFLCEIELKSKHLKRLMPYRLYIDNDNNIEIPYISRLTRTVPLFIIINRGNILPRLTETQVSIIKKSLMLDQKELDLKYKEEMKYIGDNKNVTHYAKYQYVLWKFSARLNGFMQVKLVRYIIWFLNVTISTIALLMMLSLLILFPFMKEQPNLFDLSVAIIIVGIYFLMTLYNSYRKFGKETVYESRRLGNDDNHSIKMEQYKNKLRKDKTIKKWEF